MSNIGDLNKQKRQYQNSRSHLVPIRGELNALRTKLNNKENFSGVDKVSDAIKDIDESLTALDGIAGDLSTAIDAVENKIQSIKREQEEKDDETLDEEDEGDK